ncbi:MAG TPA: ABC transporter substrate-binding protein, partial [Methylomirabilota bacterium]|nr:ABC transporter substrate-binding protein [Methylomirabilota bacterium]
MASESFTRREVTRRSVLVGGAAAVGGLVIGGLAGSALAPKSSSGGGGSRGSVKVVGIFPTGGVIASDGKEMANGTKMAVDEINARGGLIGYHLDYVEIDDKDSSTDQITTAFNRAVSVEKADVIFSGYHLASGPEFDIVANAGALYYNVNTQIAWVQRYKSNPDKYWGIFQCDPTESWYGQGFAYWVDGALNAGLLNSKVKTYSIISGKSAYGTVIATGFETQIKQLGWTG